MSLFPSLGFGVGLRHCHFSEFLNKEYKEIDWVEALTENYLPWEDGQIRRPYQKLLKIREDLPVVLHGVSMSIGSTDPIDFSYLERLKKFASELQPIWISDHLCWGSVGGKSFHDLLPLPYSEEALHWVVDRIKKTQEFLGRRILMENVSSYVEFDMGELTEWEFLSEVAKQADCGILLDVNNIYVSSYNHHFDPYDYLAAIPWERVGQIHLAGHTDKGTHLIDTHDHAVCKKVWDLYRYVSRELPSSSVMIEWDDHIPKWTRLQKEVHRARDFWEGKNAPSRKSSEVARAL